MTGSNSGGRRRQTALDGAELEVMEEEENKREEADREEGEAWWRGWRGGLGWAEAL